MFNIMLTLNEKYAIIIKYQIVYPYDTLIRRVTPSEHCEGGEKNDQEV